MPPLKGWRTAGRKGYIHRSDTIVGNPYVNLVAVFVAGRGRGVVRLRGWYVVIIPAMEKVSNAAPK